MITGSASNQELWADGTRAQSAISEQPMNIVTVTWMKLCFQLLRLTGDPVWADELEVSLYNALLGAMTPHGNWWAYWCPLSGQPGYPAPPQHDDVQLIAASPTDPADCCNTALGAHDQTTKTSACKSFAPDLPLKLRRHCRENRSGTDTRSPIDRAHRKSLPQVPVCVATQNPRMEPIYHAHH